VCWVAEVELVRWWFRCQGVLQLLTSLPNCNPFSLPLRHIHVPSFPIDQTIAAPSQDESYLSIIACRIDNLCQHSGAKRLSTIHLFSQTLTTLVTPSSLQPSLCRTVHFGH
jgi:hypothetical protein